MEGDELLSVKTFHPQIIKTVKGSTENLQKSFFLNYGIRKTKRALSLVDSTIALIIVTPLIVGFWSGTWNMIDLYSNVFPPYETFFLGAACHLCFAIVREGLQNLIQFEDKSWPKVILAFAIRRIYTYFFAVTSILNWRSGWALYDIWTGLRANMTYKDVPRLTLYLNFMVLGFGAVTLICLRSVRNLLAAPFVIGIDTKTSAFDFPTRFKKKISYTTFYAINKNSKAKRNNTASTEKFVATEVTVEKQLIKNVPPRPFGNDFRGELPSGFSPSNVPATTSYNLISNHKIQPQPQPHNIQDIIHYLTENAHRPKDLIKQHQNNQRDETFKLIGTAHGIQKSETKNYAYSQVRFPQDPFFAYKPQDPSDINLLAPNGVRFAPAISMPSTAKTARKNQNVQESESVAQSVTKNGKPLSLTLNIYPSNLEKSNGLPRYQYDPLNSIQPKNRNGKMVLHLNIYPKAGNMFQSQKGI